MPIVQPCVYLILFLILHWNSNDCSLRKKKERKNDELFDSEFKTSIDVISGGKRWNSEKSSSPSRGSICSV